MDEDSLRIEMKFLMQTRKSAEKILSKVLRTGMGVPGEAPNSDSAGVQKLRVKNGIPVSPSRGERVSMKHVRRIMEEEGI